MANTIARAIGGDADREKTKTATGSRYASAQANTWRTLATVTTGADGRVQFEVTRDGIRLCAIEVSAEELMGADSFSQVAVEVKDFNRHFDFYKHGTVVSKPASLGLGKDRK